MASSYMCIKFEEVEFVKIQFDYSNSVKDNDSHHSCKSLVPRLVTEREQDCTNGH